LARTVIRRLVAQDEAAGVDVVIEPGAVIDSYFIERKASAAEVYVMEFRADGRQLRCPLVEFQARTETAAGAVVESPLRAAESVH
jgi:hypothetical protein